ncbi:hypothetical protein GGR57DRAFT_476012 [Xylariaceae sp. FL1272]|nr:hypothetical protein GGR57DRAFT_476012 [Xylariaceae sp. FL1272]
MSIFGPKTPQRVDTDDVCPVPFFDDTFFFRRIVLYNLSVYDEVLDPKKLRDALERLARRDGWRKLGGRVRRTNQGLLELHVPTVFSESRQAIAFTHVSHDMRKDDHPLASRLPKPVQDRPAIVGDPDEYLELARGPGCPSGINDYLYTDRPLFGIHIVSFKDATLVSLHWLHIASDTLGNRDIMDNWVLSLQGRDDDIKPLAGFDTDPLAELGKHPTEPHVLADKRMATGTMVSWVLKNIGDLAFRAKENRMVCIPAKFTKKLHATALRDLAANGDPNPFLTENDVLMAFWTRLALCHLPEDSDKPVTVGQAVALRRTLEKDLMPPGYAYIGNGLGFMNVLMPASDILSRPLSYTASTFRKALNEQRTRAQVEAYAAIQRELTTTGPIPVMFGEAATHQITYSNWTMSGLFGKDFSAARVTPRDGPCLPSYINHSQMPYQFGEGFLFMGKDKLGNYWICGYRPKGLWAHWERGLKEWSDFASS